MFLLVVQTSPMYQCPPRRAAMRQQRPSRPTRQILLFPPARPELRVELAAPQQQELIRALAELLLRAATDGGETPGVAHDDR
jgi:hypothetical protein